MIILPESSVQNLFALWILSQVIPHPALKTLKVGGDGGVFFVLFYLHCIVLVHDNKKNNCKPSKYFKYHFLSP